ncbi:hypothetical protein EV286_103468 [Rhizobium sp. BK251]|nr:hypothetical protein EV286_103468 [Rhizobium sp. BK251]
MRKHDSGWRCASRHLPHGDDPATHTQQSQSLGRIPVPLRPRPADPCLHLPRPVIGYTGRRSGEAGPVPQVGDGRKSRPAGSAEHGLPLATRGAGERASGRPLPAAARNSAPGAPVWRRKVAGLKAASDRMSDRISGCRRLSAGRPAAAEGPKSRAQTAEAGHVRVSLFIHLPGTRRAPAETFSSHGRRRRVRAKPCVERRIA